MSKNERYTLIRVFNKIEETCLGKRTRISVEEIGCKTLKDAIDLSSCLSEEEKVLGSYIFDNASHKKLTLKGEY